MQDSGCPGIVQSNTGGLQCGIQAGLRVRWQDIRKRVRGSAGPRFP